MWGLCGCLFFANSAAAHNIAGLVVPADKSYCFLKFDGYGHLPVMADLPGCSPALLGFDIEPVITTKEVCGEFRSEPPLNAVLTYHYRHDWADIPVNPWPASSPETYRLYFGVRLVEIDYTFSGGGPGSSSSSSAAFADAKAKGNPWFNALCYSKASKAGNPPFIWGIKRQYRFYDELHEAVQSSYGGHDFTIAGCGWYYNCAAAYVGAPQAVCMPADSGSVYDIDPGCYYSFFLGMPPPADNTLTFIPRHRGKYDIDIKRNSKVIVTHP